MLQLDIQTDTLLGEVFMHMAKRTFIDNTVEIDKNAQYIRDMTEYEKAIHSVILRYQAEMREIDSFIKHIDDTIAQNPADTSELFKQKAMYTAYNLINYKMQLLYNLLVVEVVSITPLESGVELQFCKGFKICKLQPTYNLVYFAQFMIPGEA